jgi:hypothetical protein
MQCIFFKSLIFIAMTVPSGTFCSRSFHPIHCDISAMFSDSTPGSARAFLGPCPTSPAAAIPNARNAGTSTMRRARRHLRAPRRYSASRRSLGWICGFYPGSRPGEYQDGTATFDQARADFFAFGRAVKSDQQTAAMRSMCRISRLSGACCAPGRREQQAYFRRRHRRTIQPALHFVAA